MGTMTGTRVLCTKYPARVTKIGCRHKRVRRITVGVLVGVEDELMLGMRVRRLMGLREGNIANASCWGINPLSLEHDGRTPFYRCTRSNGIIGGKVMLIFDSLTGWGERERVGETRWKTAMQKRKRVNVTGTPMLGLPPVPSRDCAFVWYEVYSGLARITLHVVPSWLLLYP
jgi:hypothetical protein